MWRLCYDYADVSIKKQLLGEILRGWLQISKVLFALIPVLATKGRAEYGGAGFLLSDNFGETEEERARNILFVILTNVVGFFKDDIYSSKISPLLYGIEKKKSFKMSQNNRIISELEKCYEKDDFKGGLKVATKHISSIQQNDINKS